MLGGGPGTLPSLHLEHDSAQPGVVELVMETWISTPWLDVNGKAPIGKRKHFK